jgi:hypothetical protein
VEARFVDEPYSARWLATIASRSPMMVYLTGIMIDRDGGVIAGGGFVDRIVIGRVTKLEGSGGMSGYVARFSPSDGLLAWAHRFGSTGSDVVYGFRPSTTDDIIALFRYSGYARGWQLGNVWLPGSTGGAIAQLSRDTGAVVSAQRLPGYYPEEAKEQDGRLLVVAHQADGNRMSSGRLPLTLLSLDKAGNVLWERQLDWSMEPDDLLVKETKIVIAGSLETEAGGRQIVVRALSTEDGSERWTATAATAPSLAGLGAGSVRKLALTSDGDIIVGGVFEGQLELDGMAVESAGGTDIFLARLGGDDGQCRWLRQIGGRGDEVVLDLASGARGFFLLGATTEAFEHEGIELGGGQMSRVSAGVGESSFLIEFGRDGKGAITILANVGMRQGRIAVDPWGNLILVAAFHSREGLRWTTEILGTDVPTAGEISILKLQPNSPVQDELRSPPRN